jgi:hypothetical protein
MQRALVPQPPRRRDDASCDPVDELRKIRHRRDLREVRSERRSEEEP